MKIPFLLIFSIFAVILFSSCRSQKPLGYVEDFTDTSGKVQVKYPEPLIKKDDVLSIIVYSDATDGGVTDAMYNLANAGTGSAATQGFLVDIDGNIQYPRIGKIKAEGLTKAQLSEEIRKKITGTLSNPSVLVRLLNFKVTMLGEVSRPGPITIPTEKITILEAIGLAGDINIYGRREDVVILRPTDSTIEHGTIDLSSKNLFNSPYYFLRQNDVVLVNPNKNKARLSDQVFNQRLGIAFSMINMIALLYNIFHQ
ncbi:MAG TPA: polysaccharide biosynthesis/export family protein [Chitinophagaceae bacterium]|nr:polysaccharide biosynthesis/export family protein [Chitinophagaceae bacterium]